MNKIEQRHNKFSDFYYRNWWVPKHNAIPVICRKRRVQTGVPHSFDVVLSNM